MYRLIIAFVLVTITAQSQEVTFQEIDATTLALYQKESWYELAQYGKELKPQKIDYYLYNVRLGVAHFNLGAYYIAVCYFNKASKNNTTSFVQSYLYWSYINLGQVEKAKEIYNSLDEETQLTIKNCNKVVTSLYAEVGLKNSNNPLQDNLTYYSLSGLHRFSDTWSASSSIGFIKQESIGETNNQYQLGITPSYYLSKGRSLSLNYVYANNTNEQSGTTSFGPWNATTGITNNVVALNYSKQFYRSQFTAFTQYIGQSLVTTGSVGIPQTSKTFNNTVVGISYSYTFPINRDGVSFGATAVTAFGSSNALLLSPFVSTKITSKLFLKATYYSVDEFLYFDKESNILFTNTATKTNRIAAVLTYAINPNWQVIGTYSNETITNTNATLNHQLNSFFIGLNYNF